MDFSGDTLARQLTQYDLTGITPEELQKKTVADITKQNLDIIFIGINPGYHSALTGHHYSGSGTFYGSENIAIEKTARIFFFGKKSKNIFRKPFLDLSLSIWNFVGIDNIRS